MISGVRQKIKESASVSMKPIGVRDEDARNLIFNNFLNNIEPPFNINQQKQVPKHQSGSQTRVSMRRDTKFQQALKSYGVNPGHTDGKQSKNNNRGRKLVSTSMAIHNTSAYASYQPNENLIANSIPKLAGRQSKFEPNRLALSQQDFKLSFHPKVRIAAGSTEGITQYFSHQQNNPKSIHRYDDTITNSLQTINHLDNSNSCNILQKIPSVGAKIQNANHSNSRQKIHQNSLTTQPTSLERQSQPTTANMTLTVPAHNYTDNSHVGISLKKQSKAISLQKASFSKKLIMNQSASQERTIPSILAEKQNLIADQSQTIVVTNPQTLLSMSNIKISQTNHTKFKQQQASKRSQTGGTGSQQNQQAAKNAALLTIQQQGVPSGLPLRSRKQTAKKSQLQQSLSLQGQPENNDNFKPGQNQNDFNTIQAQKLVRTSFEDQNPVEDPSDEKLENKDGKRKNGQKQEKQSAIMDSLMSTQKEFQSRFSMDTLVQAHEELAQLQAKMNMVQSMIQDEQDYFGALQVLHPELHDHLQNFTKKLQRKVETLELKQNTVISQTSKEQIKNDQSSVDQRIVGLERVNKEMKKQLQCYKEEIENFKASDDTYVLVENYQKLITDFNSLYDHYKAQKLVNKKMRVELQQSNQRERTFIKLLKKTEQYAEQALQLEEHYDKLYTKEGHSKDAEIGGAGATIQVKNGEVTIPKLNLSVIYMQQNAQNREQQQQESGDGDDDDQEDSEAYVTHAQKWAAQKTNNSA